MTTHTYNTYPQNAKVNTTLTIDFDLKEKAKRNGLNLSQVLSEAIRSRLYLIEETDFDIEIKKKRLEELNFIVEPLIAERSMIQSKIEEYQRSLLKKEQELLEARKVEEEKKSRCMNCGGKLKQAEKGKYPFKKGDVCRGCFLASTKEQQTMWNE